MANVDIAVLQQFLATVGSPAEDLIFGPKNDEPVFHYTDLNGLLGIVQNHDLWLTNARYSNDDREMLHGLQVTEDVIKERREAALGDPLRLDYLDRVQKELATTSDEGVYVTSFCLKDDLLSQWRGYGANGTGVCVELDPRRFDWVTGADSPHGGLMRFWKAFYATRTQQSIIGTTVDYAFSQQPATAFLRRLAPDAAWRLRAGAVGSLAPVSRPVPPHRGGGRRAGVAPKPEAGPGGPRGRVRPARASRPPPAAPRRAAPLRP